MIDLSNNIQSGVIKAQKDYITWANVGLGHSAEYLIVANIAQKMAELKIQEKLEFIYVEQSIKELAEWDELSEEYRKGRCDICVEDEENYAIIEVKNTLTSKGKKYNSIITDLKRIELFLKNKNYIKDSYICFINANYINDKEDTDFNRNEIKEKIFKRLKHFEIDIKEKFKNLLFTISTQIFIEETNEDTIWAWQSVVIKVELK